MTAVPGLSASAGRTRALAVTGRLAVAGLAAAGVAGLYRLMVLTLHGQALDQAVMTKLSALHPRLDGVTQLLLTQVTPLRAGMAAAAVLALGALTYRLRGLLAGAVVIGGSFATAELLKLTLERPAIAGHGTWNSFPSGHVATVTAIGVALALLAPRIGRPLAVLIAMGASCAIAVAVMVQEWHRPSDVAAALLVAVGWGSIGALLRGPRAPR